MVSKGGAFGGSGRGPALQPIVCETVPAPGLPDILGASLDERTLAYVLAARVPFDLLRQCAGQLAGLLVLSASGARAGPDHSLLERARSVHQEADDALRRTAPPEPARHHHRHLLSASEQLRAALLAAARHRREGDDATIDAVLVPLRQGYRELQWSSAALPGFEIVAFEQGCCVSHPPIAPTGGRVAFRGSAQAGRAVGVPETGRKNSNG